MHCRSGRNTVWDRSIANRQRRTDLEETSLQFLNAFRCEPVPERASDSYADLKLARQKRGLSLDENDLWVTATALTLGAGPVTRDGDFAGVPGLSVVVQK